MSEHCKADTGDTWHYRACGRPLTNDEQIAAGLCARHLTGKKRRDATLEAHRERDRQSAAARAGAERTCAALTELGLDAEPYYEPGRGSVMGRYTGHVVVDGEALLKLLSPLPDTERSEP